LNATEKEKMVYIAGPMSGLPLNNYPAFYAAEVALTALGLHPINPARMNMMDDVETAMAKSIASIGDDSGAGRTWEYYLRRSLAQITDVYGVCLLPDWRRSRGATLEVQVATALSIPMYILENGELKPRVEVIGISGRIRSGKDDVGAYLRDKGWEHAGFADRIRRGVLAVNPRVTMDMRVQDMVDQHGWDISKIASPEIRGLLQRFGKEFGRDLIGENTWIDLAMRDIPDGSRVVIQDCRFPNEADKVKELGGQMWRVNNPHLKETDEHESETALDDYDFDVVFENDGSAEELYIKVQAVLDNSSFGG
jgi:hypothetical protein